MKKRIYMLLFAAASFGLPACNTETGTVHDTPEGYGAGQREPGDTGNGGPTRDNTTTTANGAGTDTGRTTGTQAGETDTTGTSATMKTKTGVGTSQTRGTTNTSKSETTKNVEVKKQ